MTSSLFERIGGAPAVEATVSLMYKKILSDDELSPFFAQTDMKRLQLSQSAFVTYAFGGPNQYSGDALRHVHARSVREGLNEEHFNRVAIYLAESMRELSVHEHLITEAVQIVASTKADVLGQ